MPWPPTCGHWAIAMGNSSAVCSHANAGPTVSTGRVGRECGFGLTFKFCSYSPAGPAPGYDVARAYVTLASLWAFGRDDCESLQVRTLSKHR
jgi:hypothetical protein